MQRAIRLRYTVHIHTHIGLYTKPNTFHLNTTHPLYRSPFRSFAYFLARSLARSAACSRENSWNNTHRWRGCQKERKTATSTGVTLNKLKLDSSVCENMNCVLREIVCVFDTEFILFVVVVISIPFLRLSWPKEFAYIHFMDVIKQKLYDLSFVFAIVHPRARAHFRAISLHEHDVHTNCYTLNSICRFRLKKRTLKTHLKERKKWSK